MSDLVLRHGWVIDPANGIDGVTDVLIRDGTIVAVGEVGETPGVPDYDATGLVVCPGLIDVHVHLRVPGFEQKETLATGTAAAAAGGFTTVCCMPNTKPALDSPEVVEDLQHRIRREAAIRVLPIATITRGRSGGEAVDFAALADAGVIGFSDDGDTTANSAIMRQALEASNELGLPVIVHCEDKALASGAMNEGDVSRRLGITGIPSEAEEIIIARDLILAELTGGWLHVCHVSSARGVALIREAKRRGVHVTAEAMPHHLTMDDEWVAGSRHLLNVSEPDGRSGEPADPNTKVNPPLRTALDTRAVLTGLLDGTLDCLATDHAPHAAPEKQGSSYENAAFGMSGSEFALPLTLALVRAGHLSLSELISKWTVEPAKLLAGERGSLTPGVAADMTVFDPDAAWTVCAENLKTKSPNTPLLGMTMRGQVKLTLVDGEERYRA